MFKSALKIIGVILLALFQVSFLYHFPGLRAYFHPILLGVILAAAWIGPKRSLYFGLVAGICLDLYSSYPFGLITVSLLVPVLISSYLFKKFFARRSIYSTLIIVVVSTAAYWLTMLALTSLMSWLNWSPSAITLGNPFMQIIGGQIIVNIIITSAVYLAIKFLRARLRFPTLNAE